MLGLPLLYFKGMRLMMFQLSGSYYRVYKGKGLRPATGRAWTRPLVARTGRQDVARHTHTHGG